MKPTKTAIRQLCLAFVSSGTLAAGVISMQSCGGEGGAIGGGGGGGNGGSLAAAFRALQPAAQQNATFVGSTRCGDCHGPAAKLASSHSRGEISPTVYEHWLGTKHASEDVGCESCHGPGSVHADDPATSNILTFPNSTNPIVCGQCHGPIYDEWKASGHAKVVPSPVVGSGNSLSSATNSQCFVCHSGLVRTKVEEGLIISSLTLAQAKELADQTYNEQDPSSSAVPFTASCVTCHSPHKQTGNLNREGKENQLWHATDNRDTTAIAPGTTASSFVYFNQICAECHNGRGANGADSKLQTSTSRPNMHDSPQYNMLMGVGGAESEAGPIVRNMAHSQMEDQCVKCHMPRSRHTFTVSLDTSCSPCHTADDAAARMASARNQILPGLAAVETRMQNWAQTTFGDSTLWDYTSMVPEGHTAPDQSLIPIEIKRARHNYYFVVRDACYGPHNAPYAKYLIQVANDNLDALAVPTVAPATVTATRSLDSIEQGIKRRVQAAKALDAWPNDD